MRGVGRGGSGDRGPRIPGSSQPGSSSAHAQRREGGGSRSPACTGWWRMGALLRSTVAERAAAERVAAERAAAAVRWQRMRRRAGFFPGFCELLQRVAAEQAAAAVRWQRMRRRALWRLTLVEHPLLLAVPMLVLVDRACKRAAADLAPVIAALEWRFECEARSALARLADAFSGDTPHWPRLDGGASEPQDA